MAAVELMPICGAGGPGRESSFCHCSVETIQDSCRCGEEADCHEWAWDDAFCTPDTHLVGNNRGVLFHPGYSSGTAAVRGDTPCEAGRDYYWEIKMLTPLYGTDVMVGVGTPNAELSKSRYQFCSLLGCDQESWGYSYKGHIQHNGEKKSYGPGFGQGSVIGVRLDMWNGTLQFFLNRIPLGIAFTNLKGKVLYPMVCSTAAHSSMRVIYSFSCKSSLQLLCMQELTNNKVQMEHLMRVPGFRNSLQRAFWWLAPDPYIHNCKLASGTMNVKDSTESRTTQQEDTEHDTTAVTGCVSHVILDSDADSDLETSLLENSHAGLVSARS
ncbi:SPRY domain-containing SOCS box protein 3 isoform X1 [Schistocerca serialis cubense]|uniref:SPRY domain-containing SOCS box protein 3 isoform X1 n=1 Tax=Schistocerca serialis cubense TaxID=2023355 RepID=UPI00214F2C80|nr:SPRY domain-containing SOCS box protein 3 isoform X1 [Schistocerca serialis cubense]